MPWGREVAEGAGAAAGAAVAAAIARAGSTAEAAAASTAAAVAAAAAAALRGGSDSAGGLGSERAGALPDAANRIMPAGAGVTRSVVSGSGRTGTMSRGLGEVRDEVAGGQVGVEPAVYMVPATGSQVRGAVVGAQGSAAAREVTSGAGGTQGASPERMTLRRRRLAAADTAEVGMVREASPRRGQVSGGAQAAAASGLAGSPVSSPTRQGSRPVSRGRRRGGPAPAAEEQEQQPQQQGPGASVAAVSGAAASGATGSAAGGGGVRGGVVPGTPGMGVRRSPRLVAKQPGRP